MYDEHELWEWEQEHYRVYGDAPATESEAHAEWHRNSGVPMGQPCPWDACDPGPYPEDDDEPPYGSFPEEQGGPADLIGAPYRQARDELEARGADPVAYDDSDDIPF